MSIIPTPKEFAFKKTLVDVIPPINFLTHNLYSYPAKFIPHVPYYTISKYLKQDNSIVLDPFSGSSSTAIEALRLGHNCICIDINPLTNFLTEVKTQRINFELQQNSTGDSKSFISINKDNTKCSTDNIYLDKFMEKMKNYSDEFFYPKWNNIDHWYPEEFKHILARIWGFIYSIEANMPVDFMNLTKLCTLYLSRYLSYGARDVPKLFKSKRRIQQLETLREKVSKNPEIPYKVFKNKMISYYTQMKSLSSILFERKIYPEYEFSLNKSLLKSVDGEKRKIICLGETDVLSYEFPIENEFIDLIVTSPPYIYAQEYMRSTKLDLYWLDLVNDSRVRELTKKELGNKKTTDRSTIMYKLRNIETFISISQILEKAELKKYGKNGKYVPLVFNYFYDMYLIIEKLHTKLRKKGEFGFFVGNPTVLGHLIPCHKIFCEIFQDIGFKIIEIGFDRIMSPRLLKGRKNESPQGMDAEWLIISRKTNK